MDILDIHGKQIREGLRVKYTGTHTIGKVNEILIKNGAAWIKLDSNGLYYRSDYVEVIEGKNGYIKPKKLNSTKSKSEKFDIEIPVEISDSTDGPGVGGG